QGVGAARRRSTAVLMARPVEIETKLSFAGLADLLEPVLDDVLPELPGPQRRAFEGALLITPARAHPDPRGVALPLLRAPRPPAAPPPPAQPRGLLSRFAAWQCLAPSSPQVPPSAARPLARERVGFLTPRRSDEHCPPARELEPALPSRQLERLSLGPLGVA